MTYEQSMFLSKKVFEFMGLYEVPYRTCQSAWHFTTIFFDEKEQAEKVVEYIKNNYYDLFKQMDGYIVDEPTVDSKIVPHYPSWHLPPFFSAKPNAFQIGWRVDEK